jgi:hypothetical protein
LLALYWSKVGNSQQFERQTQARASDAACHCRPASPPVSSRR